MTYASCLAAAVALLQAQVPALAIVADAEDRAINTVQPHEYPAVLLLAGGTGTEDRLAYGYKVRTWTLECHVWGQYNPVAGSADTFRGLVESVETVFRDTPRLGGQADTSTSQVMRAGDGPRGILSEQSDVIRQGQTATRHALVSVQVRELFSV